MTDMKKSIFQNLGKNSGLKIIDYFNFMWAPIGFLPYLKIPISPSFAWQVDKILNKTALLNWSFVNQCAVFKKINVRN